MKIKIGVMCLFACLMRSSLAMADAADKKWVGYRNFKRPFSRILNVSDDSAAGLQLAGSNRPQPEVRELLSVFS